MHGDCGLKLVLLGGRKATKRLLEGGDSRPFQRLLAERKVVKTLH